MKKLFYILAACWLPLISFAQEEINNRQANSFMALNGGYSSLMGSLTMSDYQNLHAGYANNMGYNSGLEGAYYLTKHLGLGGLFNFASFSTAHLQSLSDGYKKDFDVDSATVTVTTQYHFYNFLIGPYFSFPVKRFTFDARALAGISYIQTPVFNVVIEDAGKSYPFSQNSAKTTAFGFQVGAGIRYTLRPHLALVLNADYFLYPFF